MSTMDGAIGANPKRLDVNKTTAHIETPIGLRRIGGDAPTSLEFSGFRDERGNTRRLVTLER